MKIVYYLLFIVIFSSSVIAKEEKVSYEKPKFSEFFTKTPDTFKYVFKDSFSKKAIPTWLKIIASSAVLYYYDEPLIKGVQKWGRDLGIGNDDKTKTLIKIGKINILRGPTDLGSLMYFIGDGWTHMTIAASFLTYGSFNSNNRAMQTGSQIFHGMMTSTIVNQISKRSFGRESPYRSSKERGAWRPFPSPNKYNTDTSKYDAMPSGHVMTATMTLTIIDTNYPESSYWVRPLGYSLITLLALQMMNNSVHWASDYPLGIGMGYVFGKAVSRYGKKTNEAVNDSVVDNIMITPIYDIDYQNSMYGLSATYRF